VLGSTLKMLTSNNLIYVSYAHNFYFLFLIKKRKGGHPRPGRGSPISRGYNGPFVLKKCHVNTPLLGFNKKKIDVKG